MLTSPFLRTKRALLKQWGVTVRSLQGDVFALPVGTQVLPTFAVYVDLAAEAEDIVIMTSLLEQFSMLDTN